MKGKWKTISIVFILFLLPSIGLALGEICSPGQQGNPSPKGKIKSFEFCIKELGECKTVIDNSKTVGKVYIPSGYTFKDKIKAEHYKDSSKGLYFDLTRDKDGDGSYGTKVLGKSDTLEESVPPDQLTTLSASGPIGDPGSRRYHISLGGSSGLLQNECLADVRIDKLIYVVKTESPEISISIDKTSISATPGEDISINTEISNNEIDHEPYPEYPALKVKAEAEMAGETFTSSEKEVLLEGNSVSRVLSLDAPDSPGTYSITIKAVGESVTNSEIESNYETVDLTVKGCGDGVCTASECASGCKEDCTALECSGNGQCDKAFGENCADNPQDCGCLGTETCCNKECIEPKCSSDYDCDDGVSCTQDKCLNPGTCNAKCESNLKAGYVRCGGVCYQEDNGVCCNSKWYKRGECCTNQDCSSGNCEDHECKAAPGAAVTGSAIKNSVETIFGQDSSVSSKESRVLSNNFKITKTTVTALSGDKYKVERFYSHPSGETLTLEATVNKNTQTVSGVSLSGDPQGINEEWEEEQSSQYFQQGFIYVIGGAIALVVVGGLVFYFVKPVHKKVNKFIGGESKEGESGSKFSCPNCGAPIKPDDLEDGECPYCGATVSP